MIRLGTDIVDPNEKVPAGAVIAVSETRDKVVGVTQIDPFITERAVKLQKESAWPIDACLRIAEAEAESLIDSLTGLKNRRAFSERIETEINRTIRNADPVSLILLDIDHFKAVNDTYGHLEGDKVLKVVASALEKEVRAGVDMVARYGGEEFAIVLSGTDKIGAEVVARKLIEAIKRETEKETKNTDIEKQLKTHVTISAGIAGCGVEWEGHSTELNAENMIAAADTALYQSKSNGRNKFTAFTIDTTNDKKKISSKDEEGVKTKNETNVQTIENPDAMEEIILLVPKDLNKKAEFFEKKAVEVRAEAEMLNQKKTGTEG